MLSSASGGRTSLKGRKPGSPARVPDETGPWAQWKQQLTAYVAWVNSQLKKKTGAHLVEDLRHDIRDGVALVDLVEVIGGEKLDGVHSAPSNYAEMRDNVDRVLHYMTSNHIKMHHITTRDIIEGNLKAIMRLILALAAHYKPNSVRHSSQTAARQNIAGIAQGAAAALTEARRQVSKAGHRHRRRRPKEDHRGSHTFSDSDYGGQAPAYCHNCRTSLTVPGTSSQTRPSIHYRSGHSSHWSSGGSIRETVEGEEGRRAELEGASGSSSPVNGHSTSPRMSLYMSDPPSSMEGLLTSGGALMSASCESDSLTDSGYVEICDSVKETHKMLLDLHDLLLHGEGHDSNLGQGGVAQGTTSREKMIVINQRLQHAEELVASLRVDLKNARKDSMELQATKVGLEKRLADRESQLTQAKSQLLTMELDTENVSLVEADLLKKQLADKEQTLADIKVSFVKQAEEKDRALAELRKEVMKRDQSLEVLREKLDSTVRSHGDGSVGAGFTNATSSASAKMDAVGTPRNLNGSSSTSRGRLDLYVKQISDSRNTHPVQLPFLTALRDSVAQLRSSTLPQGALESLEDNVISLFECMSANGHTPPPVAESCFHNGRGGLRTTNPTRMTTSALSRDIQKTSPRGGQTTLARGRGRAKPVTPARTTSQPMASRSTEITPRPTRLAGAATSSQPAIRGRSSIPVSHAGVRGKVTNPSFVENQTQVVYFMNSAEKPFSCNIQKRLGEITLGDFKDTIADSDLYHYFFKVLDPEYGTVKEELIYDEHILPGWEGKIVAWLEQEESGQV